MSINSMDFNYIRITYNNWNPQADTWKHHVPLDRLVKLICNYLVKIRLTPHYLGYDETYGLTVETSRKYLWSRTASELMITTGSDEDFGVPFDEKTAEMIKQKVVEYWNTPHFQTIRKRAEERNKQREVEHH